MKNDNGSSGKSRSRKMTHRARARRQLMKSLAAGGGVVVTGKLVPEEWKKPVLEHTILPVHAQASQCCEGTSALTCSAADVRESDIVRGSGPYSPNGPVVITGFNVDATNINMDITASLSPLQAQCGPISVSATGNLNDDTDDGQGTIFNINSGQEILLEFDGGDTGGLFNDPVETMTVRFSHPCAEDCVISFQFEAIE